jgi:hypothetical protein
MPRFSRRITAINSRIEELESDHQSTPEERAAIARALAGIRILQQEIS